MFKPLYPALCALLSILLPSAVCAVVLLSDYRAVPGDQPTAVLEYQNRLAKKVQVAGSWDKWSGRYDLKQYNGLWMFDVREWKLGRGRYEFKFIVDKKWDADPNRYFFINDRGLLERPPDLILKAAVQDTHTIDVFLKKPVHVDGLIDLDITPDVGALEAQLITDAEAGYPSGYEITGGLISFKFNPAVYGLSAKQVRQVNVAGTFNYWDGSGGGGKWRLTDVDGDGVWQLTKQLESIRPVQGQTDLQFKFVLDGDNWLKPPQNAPNAVGDGRGNSNLEIDKSQQGGTRIRIRTEQPLHVYQNYDLILKNLADRPVYWKTTPGRLLDEIVTDKTLGVVLNKEQNSTTYRLFAPRATEVFLNIYQDPDFVVEKPVRKGVAPAERYPMWQDEDGVWEVSLLGLDVGAYYAFTLDGPEGYAESWNPEIPIGDPYALAAVQAEKCPIVIDPDAETPWFSGWTDQDFLPPAPVDAMIYELHVRDMTVDTSSGVPDASAGLYAGLMDSVGTGTGLDHLKSLGINFLEFLPVAEFPNGVDRYDWGYAPAFYFAPEGSYARYPRQGSQFYEFKQMVNGLHNEGFGVILDVVFNHIGGVNVFNQIDKKYYFRLNPNFTYSNYSGCGNDVRTEAPMMRRLIVENLLYWIREHHIDGFRFDLAELIDMDTMMEIEKAIHAEYPNVLLISEPWSFRGENKHLLKGSGWSAWNNDFRYAVKDFVRGRGDRTYMKDIITSTTWAARPLQCVNYVESHDDMALADELSTNRNHDGRKLNREDIERNKLAATLLYTSLGIPMISEGQEWARSKRGISNTYNKGDEVNALRWDERKRPLAAEVLNWYTGLMQLRNSPEGAAFKLSLAAPDGYYKWIWPDNKQAIGYMINVPEQHDGAGFVVLVNCSDDPVTFNFRLPSGAWRLIGDGVTIDRKGLEDALPARGPMPMSREVPARTSFIYMNGF